MSTHVSIVEQYEEKLNRYIAEEKYSKAIKSLNHFLKEQTATFGQEPKTVDVADIYHKLGEVYQAQDDFEEAAANYSKSYKICLKVKGDKNEKTLRSLNALIKAQQLSGDYHGSAPVIVDSPLLKPKEDEPKKKSKKDFYEYTRRMTIF
eukprot:CAMPEP_0114588002 /NCGR_PEP_ID=MMETSP0125-20121206/10820_1 /TAXON_ID=485358 ORGANISM="Aristerostoma sp., Strain ATCC 50986" /NCGR_SAMPLE_ID=MMETSP0125 /ASSEMBLY_ACC=CAM_ASM_000245 /LENGTH=148 /DNA_ID=CAMNT_0001784193 /DNA_START=68 /DNA_END=514 /DNA_ORIENTATION=+